MKKKSYLLGMIVLMALSFSAYAQKNVKITWGDEFELPKKSYELGFIGNPKVGYTEISHARGKAINLQKFTPSLKLTSTNAISTKNFPKHYTIDAIGVNDGKNYIYYSTWEKKEGVEKLFAQEIDPGRGEFKGSPKELLSSATKLTGALIMTGFYQFNTVGKWRFVSSADSSKLMIHYRVKPKEKRDAINKDIIGVFVFDKGLNKIWGREIEMPYTEKVMDNEDYQVDSKGNVYILAKVTTGEKKDKQTHYEVLFYDKNSKTPVISSFKFTDKTIVDIALNEDHTGRMVCTGFYSKSGKGTDGAFFLAYDEASKSMKNIKKGFYEFPTEIIREFESKKTKKKSEKKESKGEDEEVSNLVFRNLHIDDDGTITMYGEQYLMVVYYTYDSKGHATRHEIHYFDDIYVTTIGPDGELKWIKKIPKAQKGGSPIGLGYHLHVDGKNSYFFFVDNAKNLNLKKEEAPAVHVNGMGGVLVCVKLDADGNTTKSSIFDFREEKMNVLVKSFSDVTDKIVIGRARNLKGPFQTNFTKGKPLIINID